MTIAPNRDRLRMVGILLVVLCLSTVHVVDSTTGAGSRASSTPQEQTTRSDIIEPSQQQTEEKTTAEKRIDYVTKTLCDRWKYVHRGARSRDFSRWVHDEYQGGAPQICSMHGVDESSASVQFQKRLARKPNSGGSDSQEAHISSKALMSSITSTKTKNGFFSMFHNKRDPFLADRMNLNLANFTTSSTVATTNNSTDMVFNTGNAREKDLSPASSLQLAIRAIQLSIHFAPIWTTSWLAVLSRRFRLGFWYPWVASCLASSGAAFIKWGQWAATRTDQFPIELCDALAGLHSDAPAHSWEFTQEQVESSLDIPSGSLMDVFKSFDPEPLASGSIAQVHKAELCNGQVLAAKVRHPRVAQLIDMDFRLMEMAATLCDWIPGLRWLHVKDSVSQFSHTMAAQAHLHVEGHHLEVLDYNFRAWDHVHFPKPIYASSSLILETFEAGRIVTTILDEFDKHAAFYNDDAIQGHQLIPVTEAKLLVTSGLSIYLKMLLIDNLMHADLHPGNILLEEHHTFRPGQDTKYRITLVDAGMVAQLTDDESSTFIGLLCSLGASDARAAAEFTLRFSIENEMTVEQKEMFVKDMTEMFAERCRGYGSGVDTGDVLRGLLSLVRIHRIRIEANFATLVINNLCIESLARRVCPSYNVMDASRPLLETYRKVCYQEDGFTPRGKGNTYKRVKKLMPLMLYGKKKRSDDSFFRAIAASRRRRKLPSITNK